MHHQRCVPRAEHPVYNMVMSDVIVSCTSLEKDKRVSIAMLSEISWSIYICTFNFSLCRGCFERPCIWCLWHVTESRWHCISFFFFNLRLITLQYCGSICHTLTWVSHGCTCVSHPESPTTSLPIPSRRVIPVHQPWALCLVPQT